MEPNVEDFFEPEKRFVAQLAKMLSSSMAPIQFIEGAPEAEGVVESRIAWIKSASEKIASAQNREELRIRLTETKDELMAREGANRTVGEEAFVQKSAHDLRNILHVLNSNQLRFEPLPGIDPKPQKPLEAFLKGAFLNKAGLDDSNLAEGRILSQKQAFARRFGFEGVAVEGEHLMSFSERSATLRKGERDMEAAARRMGIHERDMGLGMGTRLILTSPLAIDLKFFGNGGSVSTGFSNISKGGQVVNFSVRPGADVGIIVHEWTHLLDASLGQKARGLAKEALLPDSPGRLELFSKQPAEIQKLMPNAIVGLQKIQAAAQGLSGGFAGLDELSSALAVRQKASLDAIATALAGRDGAMLGLSEESRSAFLSEVREPLLGILRSREATSTVILGSNFHSSWQEAGAEEKLRMSGDKVAQALNRHFGQAWLPDDPEWIARPSHGIDDSPPRPKMEPVAHLGKALGEIIEQDKQMVKNLILSHSSEMAPLNLASDFAIASRFAALGKPAGDAYWDTAHEMLARTTGRTIGYLERNIHYVKTPAHAPKMSAEGLREVGEGWAMMTKSSLGSEAAMKFNLGERFEASSGIVGRAVSSTIRASLAIQQWDDPHAPIQQKITSWEMALAHKLKKAGLLETVLRFSAKAQDIEQKIGQFGEKLKIWKNDRNSLRAAPAETRSEVDPSSQKEASLPAEPPKLAQPGFHVSENAKPTISWSSAGTAGFHAGVGALSAYGAIAAVKSAKEEAKKGNVAMATLGVAEAGAQTVVAASSAAALVGSAKLASATKVAGPLGAVLGYFGAARSAYHAREEGKLGNVKASEAHGRAALIRAGGATGSLAASIAASMAVGAAAGSVAPIVGTAVGAVVGIGVALVSEHYAQKEDQAAEAAPAGVSQKLAQRRQSSIAMSAPQQASGASRQPAIAR